MVVGLARELRVIVKMSSMLQQVRQFVSGARDAAVDLLQVSPGESHLRRLVLVPVGCRDEDLVQDHRDRSLVVKAHHKVSVGLDKFETAPKE